LLEGFVIFSSLLSKGLFLLVKDLELSGLVLDFSFEEFLLSRESLDIVGGFSDLI
jgi:hypothetical protein